MFVSRACGVAEIDEDHRPLPRAHVRGEHSELVVKFEVLWNQAEPRLLPLFALSARRGLDRPVFSGRLAPSGLAIPDSRRKRCL